MLPCAGTRYEAFWPAMRAGSMRTSLRFKRWVALPQRALCFTVTRFVLHPARGGELRICHRADLPHRCGSDLATLSLGDRLRRGAEVVLFPGESREVTLLSVHLKSGCSTALLDAREKACADLARQIPALESWIDARASEGKRFAVLGDFNRDLLADIGPARSSRRRSLHLWPELDDADPPESDLRNPAVHELSATACRRRLYGIHRFDRVVALARRQARPRLLRAHYLFGPRRAAQEIVRSLPGCRTDWAAVPLTARRPPSRIAPNKNPIA